MQGMWLGCCSWWRWCWKTLALVRLKHLKNATLSVFLLLGIGWAWTCWACGWGCCCRRRGCWETLVLVRVRHLRGDTLCCFFLLGLGWGWTSWAWCLGCCRLNCSVCQLRSATLRDSFLLGMLVGMQVVGVLPHSGSLLSGWLLKVLDGGHWLIDSLGLRLLSAGLFSNPCRLWSNAPLSL